MSVVIEVSWGELIDKISILEIKAERLSEDEALANVNRELALLTTARDRAMATELDISTEFRDLKSINERLWDIEDAIRDCERRGDFGSQFVELARDVYRTNDQRSAIEHKINKALGSALIQEKSYTTY